MESTDLDGLNYGLSHIHCVDNRRWGSEVTTVKPIRTFHVSTRCSLGCIHTKSTSLKMLRKKSRLEPMAEVPDWKGDSSLHVSSYTSLVD